MEGVALHRPSVRHILDFSVSQVQQVALFFTGWCAHHECNTSLIFHLLHTSVILFVCFVNIHTIWDILIVATSLVCIVNAFWRCIQFRNLSMKILVPFWHYYLPLFIYHSICFAMQIDSKFLIALKRSWNPAWWVFEVIKPQSFFKIQEFIIHKDPPYSTIFLGIFMCTEIQVLDQFLFHFHIFMAAASYHCTCFQFTVIKFYNKPPKILIFTFCDSKSSSTMTRIEEGSPLHLNILTCQFLISLTSQIPVFMGLISFDIWSWFDTTFLPTFQVSTNILDSIRTINNRGSVRLLRKNSRDILGLHVWAPLVDGPIRPMVQMEITAREIFKYS